MKNPLNKRLPREIRGDFGKYLVIFLLLVLSIGLISGFLVADNSMIRAYNDGFEKYNVENGHFLTERKMNKAQKKAVEANGITLYDQFYVEQTADFGAKVRIYADRKEVNTVCLMKGTLPVKKDEIALDRMFADNHELTTGDTILLADKQYTITGLVALPDYSCLFEKNSDSMFDAMLFGVAIVSTDAFAQFAEEELNYDYA